MEYGRFPWKRFCALGLGLEAGLVLRLGSELTEIRLNTFSGNCTIFIFF